MGEVYRADDLELGQPVALKFLPASVAQDEIALARLRNEVRLARQISHPNVCRVFDIGHLDGQYFLSMEYVDGEDLASVLRRMGRPSREKALQIARQICAGLRAAHENGVLHRDLKPANIMIDGRGRVRLMDFGLSGLALELAGVKDFAGTPMYMAPEQLEGSGTTVRTDLFSLGVVLYEVLAGRRPFSANTPTELRAAYRRAKSPPPPSEFAGALALNVDSVILRCLDTDPKARPASALEVAAALGGSDPLQAVLAAGETPSPELLAAAGGAGTLPLRTAWILLFSVGLVLCGCIALARYSTVLGLCGWEKSPELLIDRARDIIRAAGPPVPLGDYAYGIYSNNGQIGYLSEQEDPRILRRHLATMDPTPIRFWYRQSPEPLVPQNWEIKVSKDDPQQDVPGMAYVLLDSRGMLRTYEVFPPRSETAMQSWHRPSPEPDWTPLFAAAGLDQKQFVVADPMWVPHKPFDMRASWNGTHAGFPVHIDGAAFDGVVVSFDVNGPWTTPQRELPSHWMDRVPENVGAALGFLLVAVGMVLARRNLRLGRSDRRGAFRIGAYMFACNSLSWLLMAHVQTSVSNLWQVFVFTASNSLFNAAWVWLAYMALDPYARKYWPDLLISWNRLVAGAWRDPLVGRDVLIGALFGCLLAFSGYLVYALPLWFRIPLITPIHIDSMSLGTTTQALGYLVLQQLWAIIYPLLLTLLLVLLRLLLRNKILAAAVTCLLIAAMTLGGENHFVTVPWAILNASLLTAVLLRFSILAYGACVLVANLVGNFPMTLDFSRWYAGRSLLVLAVVAAMALYGFRCALGKQAAFGGLIAED
jgi:serine/threonine-protein kinase